MRKLTNATLAVAMFAALTGLALASGTQFTPTIENDAISFFQPEGDRSATRTLYLSLDVVDDDVIIQVDEEASPGALAHVFEAIERPSAGVWRNLYGYVTLNRVADQESDQAKVLANLRKLANMGTLASGWAITHADLSMAEAIEAYGTWFSQAGATITPDASGAVANVQPFNVTGLSDDYRVVFHREGSGVRVYIGYL